MWKQLRQLNIKIQSRSVARKSRIARNALRDLTTLVVKNEYKFNI